jgi:hypothetical protein
MSARFRLATSLAGLAIVMASTFAVASAQEDVQGASERSDARLRRDVERRFDVLMLQNGLALSPKGNAGGIRSIELTDGTIALDGVLATGAEVRSRLGSDAELVIRLSYLSSDARRRLFADRSSEPERTLSVQPAPPPLPPPPPRPERTRRSENRIRFGGSVTVAPDEIVTGDVVVIGGSAHIDGEITGDLVVVGGAAELGPNAVVGHEVTVVGGTLRRADSAQVVGSVNEVAAPGIDALMQGRWWGGPNRWSPGMWLLPFGSFFALMSTLTRLAVLSMLVCLVLLIAREQVERIGLRAASEPLKAGLVGFCAELLFLPLLVVTILVLIITIVGLLLLPLVPFVILALAIVFLVGFSAVSYHLGRVVAGRLGWTVDNPYLTAILGIVVVLSPVLLARLVGLVGGLVFPLTATLVAIGVCLEYAAWTIGFGAVALLRFDRKGLPQT